MARKGGFRIKLEYREARVGIGADRGTHRKKTRDKRVCGPRVTRAVIGLLERDRLKVYSKWNIIQSEPEQLYYLNEYSHVFEKYCDHLSCLEQHPDFRSESQHTQYHMMTFSRDLSGMNQESAFEPKPGAEAQQTDVEISEDAAISRLHPIQDGLDY
jgi:hypothetical protein